MTTAASTPSRFGKAWAYNASSIYRRQVSQEPTAQPGAASLQLGYTVTNFTDPSAGGFGPNGADTNGLLYQITNLLIWLIAGGPVYFDSTFAAAIGGYPKGAVISNAKTLGLFWLSLVDDNLQDPDNFVAGSNTTNALTTPYTLIRVLSGTLPVPALETWTSFSLVQYVGDNQWHIQGVANGVSYDAFYLVPPNPAIQLIVGAPPLPPLQTLAVTVGQQLPGTSLVDYKTYSNNNNFYEFYYDTGDQPQSTGTGGAQWFGFNKYNTVTPVPYTGHCHWRPDSPVLAGHVRCNSLTIGNASSNATERANTDTQNAFTWLWTNFTDTTAPIFTSGGAGSTRGGSAAADFAANKAISTPDMRGSWPAGLDTMGNSSASRLTNASFTTGGATQNGSRGNFLQPAGGGSSKTSFQTGTWYLQL